MMRLLSFRPLDGESISKHYGDDIYRLNVIRGFRPLDGESISKLGESLYKPEKFEGKFPSPRRGINF